MLSLGVTKDHKSSATIFGHVVGAQVISQIGTSKLKKKHPTGLSGSQMWAWLCGKGRGGHCGVVWIKASLGFHEVEVVDAEAVLWAVQSCVTHGLDMVLVEADFQALVHKLKGGCWPRATLGMLLNEIMEAVSKLDSCEWQYAKRRGK